jgi:hypothetical protein
VKLSSWPEIGSDGDVLLTPYVPKRITGYDDVLVMKFSLTEGNDPEQFAKFWAVICCRPAKHL